jgi:hypothetical protein
MFFSTCSDYMDLPDQKKTLDLKIKMFITVAFVSDGLNVKTIGHFTKYQSLPSESFVKDMEILCIFFFF